MIPDFILALDCQPHEKIPHWELEFHLWNAFTSQNFACGVDFLKLSRKEKEKALSANAGIIAEVSHELNFSAVTVPNGYWELAPGVPAYYWLPEEYRFRQAELLKHSLPENVILVANTGGVPAMPDAGNYVDFSCRLFERPEDIDQMAEVVLNQGIENVKRFAGMGLEVMMTASDLADNHGPYFSPGQMDRFILPCLHKWTQAVKDAGGRSILHTDGNIQLYLDKLADSGVSAIQAVDPVAGMDMKNALTQTKGKICLCGNIDCGLLLTGTPEEVFTNTEKLIREAKIFPGFVIGASNAVQAEVPKLNYLAMVRALQGIEADENGK